MIFRLFFARLVKLLANITKAFSYAFHFFFRSKRFSLPATSSPIISSSKKCLIPRTIWQTNFTGDVTLPVYLNYLFNRLISPTYSYRFMVTADRDKYIKEHFSGRIYEQYCRLQIGAAQADLWRLLVLYREGGIYLDIDAHAVWPLESVVDDKIDSLFVEAKRGLLSNYFIASSPGNPLLDKLINQVVDNIESGELKDVFDITGPGVFNSVLDFYSVNKVHYRYACNQGNFTNEYFQYIDKPQGKWTKEQKNKPVVK